MLGWKDVMMKQEQHSASLREAENRALVRQMLMERKRRAPSVGQLLTALVQHLNNLRCYLLERYAAALKVSVQVPCQEESL
jgi:hypothetical protein